MKYGQFCFSTLQQQQAFLQFNKYSTHREECIGWFKYFSTSITLQSFAKLRVGNLIKTAHLTSSEIISFTNTNYKPVTGTTNDLSRKRMDKFNHDVDDEWKDIVFPAFDLHMRRISFDNDDERISTIVLEVGCHPDNSSILKTILSRISSDKKKPSSEKTVNIVSYGLIQYHLLNVTVIKSSCITTYFINEK